MAAAAKKKAGTRVSPTSTSPRAVSTVGEPSGRFAEVLAQTRAAGLAIDKFEITEDFVLYPPTAARMKAMDQSSAAYLLAQSAVVSLLRSQETPPDDDEARIHWAETQQKALLNAYAQVEDAERAFNEALYGGADVLQRVEEFFVDRAGWEKEAFSSAVSAQFRRLPVDGKCQACGHVVDGDSGESEGESSGGSSISGQSSRETSPSNSAESTPVTGSEAPAPGPSSSTMPSE